MATAMAQSGGAALATETATTVFQIGTAVLSTLASINISRRLATIDADSVEVWKVLLPAAFGGAMVLGASFLVPTG